MDDLSRIISRRKRQDFIFNIVGIACLMVGIVTLLALIVDLMVDGLTRINWQFLTSFSLRDSPRNPGSYRPGSALCWL